MNTAARLAALRPVSRVILGAARAAEQPAANDNAGRVWHEHDTARAEHGRHMGTLVPSGDAVAVHVEVTDELDPGAWRVWTERLDGRRAVALYPAADRSPATERQERVFRALARAAGVECC